ncbi:MAG: hypothetical protein Q7R39_12635 [Dehalococcoidia bacterium]|nr:hypothetical protein [Dehalococcoidia bacterium]
MSVPHVSAEVVLITPDQAVRWLETKAQNRKVSEKTVAAYADSMKRGEWHVTNQGIAFNPEGCLIDGEHRLWAIIQAGIPVKMLTVMGVTDAARETIDKGRLRSLSDELRLYRGQTDANTYRGYVTHSARLVTGNLVVIKTLDALDHWVAIFKGGLAMAMDHSNGLMKPAFKVAAVGGTLAFAHKVDPEKVLAFSRRLADGSGLTKEDPEFHLRRLLLETDRPKDTMVTARKVLRALRYRLEDERPPERHLFEEGAAGMAFYRAAYKTRAGKALTDPWVVPEEKTEE